MNTPAQVAESYLGTGKTKVSLSFGRMLALAILAGIYIALAGVGASCAAVTVESASLAKLVSGCLFPAGLTMVLLAGSELFTGNCLLVMPLAQKTITPAQMLRSWVVVYLGNFIGAMAVAWIASASHTFTLFGDWFAISVVSTAAAKCSLSFTDALLRGILCNLLVCLAVWISFAAKSVGGKIAGLYLPILLFVLCGYEHCVANMYYIPAGIFALADPAYAEALAGLNAASVTWAGLAANLIPVTLGNILGGAGLGLAYWYIYLKKPKA